MIEVGVGDVFTDLDSKNAGERKLRVQSTMRINALLQESKLTQAKSLALFGIPQPHISDPKRYKLNRFFSNG